jgi:G:T/U-mismatch repair DNA glycosylase
MDIEHHPLKPFLPGNTRLLMLGSFPPARKRWCMDFFYPNFINDMWRIFGIVFYGDKNHFVDNALKIFRLNEIISLLNEKGIGIYDTACAVRRTNNTASDKDLEVVEPTDLDLLLKKVPHCTIVVTTGQKATDVFTAHFDMAQPKVGGYSEFIFQNRNMRLYRMPSSSRAYPMKVEVKAEKYVEMFSAENMLNR